MPDARRRRADPGSGQAEAVDDAAGLEPAVDDEDPAGRGRARTRGVRRGRRGADDDDSDEPEDSEDDPDEEDVDPLGTEEPDRESVR